MFRVHAKRRGTNQATIAVDCQTQHEAAQTAAGYMGYTSADDVYMYADTPQEYRRIAKRMFVVEAGDGSRSDMFITIYQFEGDVAPAACYGPGVILELP